MTVVPIASGKGGVGKSLVAANLGILLAKAGYHVTLADLDFGGSNLHLLLGVSGTADGVGAFLNDSNRDFASVVHKTDYKNLAFIPGDNEIPGLANLTSGQKRKLISRLRALEGDFLILDLGAGTSFNVMDFFLLSGTGLVVTTPTPTALVNAYLCIKNALFRLLTSTIKRGTRADEVFRELAKDTGKMQRTFLPDIVAQIAAVDPETVDRYRDAAAHFRPRIVMNMLDDPKDAEKVAKLRSSCRHYLGIDIEHFGILYRDEFQNVSLQSRLPIVLYKPGSVLSQGLSRISEKIGELARSNDAGLEWLDPDESYVEAVADAENDFEIKSDYVHELLHSGTLTEGDLLETVKSQQLEINHLRKQNDLMRTKLVRASRQGFKI
ncbi:MAG: P-loop NTPase [Spirochaetales bacterium]